MEAAPVWPADALEVGRIVDAWGIKGWIKVQAFSAGAEALLGSRVWFVRPPEKPPGPGASGTATRYPADLSVRQARLHGDVVVAQVGGCDDRAAAESLRGARLFIARSSFPKAGTDEFYWVDLIGLEVRNREGEELGRVVGLIDTGPHSVLRVSTVPIDVAAPAAKANDAEAAADPDATNAADTANDADAANDAAAGVAERLIPFVAAYVDTVDLTGRRITVDWGLDF